MKRMGKKLLAFALCLLMGGGIFLSALALKANAVTVGYSSVMDDLQKDPSFNPDDYPVKANDYSL